MWNVTELHVLMVSNRPALVNFVRSLPSRAGQTFAVERLPLDAAAVARHDRGMHRAALAVLDACPDPVAAARVAEALRARRPALPALALLCCPHRLRPWEAQALRAAGVHNLLGPHATPAEVAAALSSVARGEEVVNVRLDRRGATSLDDLLGRAGQNGRVPDVAWTKRDRDMLRLVAQGLNDREIAQRLHVSPSTVKHHVDRVRGELGARDRVALLVWLYSHGFAPPPPDEEGA